MVLQSGESEISRYCRYMAHSEVALIYSYKVIKQLLLKQCCSRDQYGADICVSYLKHCLLTDHLPCLILLLFVGISTRYIFGGHQGRFWEGSA